MSFRLGVSETPSVVVFKKFDEGKNILSKDKFADLDAAIKVAATPLIVKHPLSLCLSSSI
jgi:hypothetical protein